VNAPDSGVCTSVSFFQVNGPCTLKQNFLMQQTKQDLIIACNNAILACKLMRKHREYHKESFEISV
jgi:hypothetical protein